MRLQRGAGPTSFAWNCVTKPESQTSGHLTGQGKHRPVTQGQAEQPGCMAPQSLAVGVHRAGEPGRRVSAGPTQGTLSPAPLCLQSGVGRALCPPPRRSPRRALTQEGGHVLHAVAHAAPKVPRQRGPRPDRLRGDTFLRTGRPELRVWARSGHGAAPLRKRCSPWAASGVPLTHVSALGFEPLRRFSLRAT